MIRATTATAVYVVPGKYFKRKISTGISYTPWGPVYHGIQQQQQPFLLNSHT